MRKALAAVAGAEIDQIDPALGALDERERGEALGVAVLVTGYVAVDSCGTDWPTQHSIRRIAEDLAATGTVSRKLRLDPERIAGYLSRVVLGREFLDEFFEPGDPDFVRFPVIVANRATGVNCPRDIEIWDYMDQIESAIEAAGRLQAAGLTAAALRSNLPSSKSGVQLRGRKER